MITAEMPRSWPTPRPFTSGTFLPSMVSSSLVSLLNLSPGRSPIVSAWSADSTVTTEPSELIDVRGAAAPGLVVGGHGLVVVVTAVDDDELDAASGARLVEVAAGGAVLDVEEDGAEGVVVGVTQGVVLVVGAPGRVVPGRVVPVGFP